MNQGTVTCASRPQALLSALLAGLMYNSFSHHIRIFLPDCSLADSLFRTSKHPNLFLSRSIIDLLSLFLHTDELHHVDIFRYSIKWSGLPGRDIILAAAEQAQLRSFPTPPSPLLSHKACLIREWEHLYLSEIRIGSAWDATIPPDGRDPPPFIQGAISRKDRRTFSASVQLVCKHGFIKPYSDTFRRQAGDNNVCPCNHPPISPTPHAALSLPLSPTRSFDDLMAAFLAPASQSHSSPPLHTSTPPPSQPQRPRPRPFPNDREHVLLHCPLHSSPRQRIFGRSAFMPFIFGTADGARKLGEFLRASNRLMHPLPPRPDPP